MQEFDFDKFVDRRDTAALKWSELPDGGQDVIPLWIADMDFEVAPCIKAALRSRVEHGVGAGNLGYHQGAHLRGR